MNISIPYYITKSLVIPENALNNEKSKRTDTHEYFTGGATVLSAFIYYHI